MLRDYINQLQNGIKNINMSLPNSESYLEELQQTLKVATKFEKLSKSLKEHEVTKSPYSNSFYLIPKGTKVRWGGKPENSYRFSNHWHWETRNEYTGIRTLHCPTNTGKNFGIAIGKYKDGLYYEVDLIEGGM